MVRNKSYINLTYITHFYIDQENIDTVVSLLRYYEKMDPWILDQVQFVIVDDGSPIEYQIPDFDLHLLWIKINENIPWNQGGARNLGVVYARSDNIFLSDIDWQINEESFRFMLSKKRLGRTIYKIREYGRKKGHSNMWFMSRARFFRFYGYDERFSGGHGGEDYFFFKIQQYSGSVFRYMPYNCYAIRRAESGLIDLDKSYHSLKRDPTRNDKIGEVVRRELELFGPERAHSRTILNFTWKILLDKDRNVKYYKRPIKKYWKYFWFIKWIFGYW